MHVIYFQERILPGMVLSLSNPLFCRNEEKTKARARKKWMKEEAFRNSHICACIPGFYLHKLGDL
jgi:hypothetical protein